MKQLTLLFFVFTSSLLFAQQKLPKNKALIEASVESHKSELIGISDEIWGKAETAFEEYESSEILSDFAEKNGFTVQKGVAGMPTGSVCLPLFFNLSINRLIPQPQPNIGLPPDALPRS